MKYRELISLSDKKKDTRKIEQAVEDAQANVEKQLFELRDMLRMATRQYENSLGAIPLDTEIVLSYREQIKDLQSKIEDLEELKSKLF